MKKVLCIILVALLVFGSAACGKSEEPVLPGVTEYSATEVDGEYSVLISPMPKKIDDIYEHIDTDDPVNVSAYFMAGLVRAAESESDGFEIMDYLCASKSPFEDSITEGMPEKETHKAWLKEAERNYIPRSYYQGATPENGYTPDEPWTIGFKINEAQTTDYNSTASNGYEYIVYDIQSSGRDTTRQLVLFKRPKDTRWYMNSFSGILTQIQAPK